jgi:sterol desaturase/sphingolipid hydroxylase (fatty acid hydroxylase superfamily)
MHSFHHSANALTFVTGARHLWMERVMTSAVLPIMPILFQIPPGMLLILSLIHFFPDRCARLNVRFPMGMYIRAYLAKRTQFRSGRRGPFAVDWLKK